MLDYINAHGDSAEYAILAVRGPDGRAANNLVRKNILTSTNGVFRLRDRKPAKVAEKAEPAEERAAVTVKEPAVVPVVKEAANEAPAADATKKAAAEKAKKPVKNIELRPCLCGCGSASKSRFLPGHDARLHSIVLRIHRGKAPKDELTEASATLDYLKTAPWMTDEIAKSIELPLQ